jgi:hypothetical protein
MIIKYLFNDYFIVFIISFTYYDTSNLYKINYNLFTIIRTLKPNNMHIIIGEREREKLKTCK